MYVTSELDQVLQPTAVAIGNFDGIHRGHQQVLQPILQAPVGVKTVLTFHPHPQAVLKGESRLLLTPLTERQEYFAQLGIEQVILLPFTSELSHQTAAEFIEKILEQGLAAQQVSVGWDFCFGYQRSGNADTLTRWGERHRIPISVIPKLAWEGERISSSRIRDALSTGEVKTAKQLLGRYYRLQGEVVTGDQRGRILGFPTANLAVPLEKVLPQFGVYSVWAHLPTQPDPLPAILNVGIRPTFTGLAQRVEVHLLDWHGDLYGQQVKVDLSGFIRPERKFGSGDELKQQIQADCEVAGRWLKADPY